MWLLIAGNSESGFTLLTLPLFLQEMRGGNIEVENVRTTDFRPWRSFIQIPSSQRRES